MSRTASEPRVDVLLVIGISGAGRGTVAKVLEDAGWYVADNVPSDLIPRTIEINRDEGAVASRIAFVIHTRAQQFAAELDRVRSEVEAVGVSPRVVFLDASDAALVRRFEQVRRRHPLQGNGTLMEGIATERKILAPLKERADLVVDTSALSVARLREIIEGSYAESSVTDINVAIESFGFKYGLPIDADLVADVRFLPNPYWENDLRDFTGQDQPVRDYVLGQADAERFLQLYAQLIRLVAGGYRREGKKYMTVAIGCTGGKHRSVAITERLAAILSAPDADESFGGQHDSPDAFAVRVLHRDLGRE